MSLHAPSLSVSLVTSSRRWISSSCAVDLPRPGLPGHRVRPRRRPSRSRPPARRRRRAGRAVCGARRSLAYVEPLAETTGEPGLPRSPRAASSIGYSTRRHSAVQLSRSSSSHAARGSPSRGWPTLPGLISHLPVERSCSVPPGACIARRRSSLVAREAARHVRVADRRRRAAPSRPCTRRPAGSTARTPRPDRAGWRGRGRPPRRRAAGSRPPRKSSAPRPTCSRVQRAASAACGEKSAMSMRPSTTEVVVAGQAEVAALGGQLHALVRVRAVARRGRRGTRAPSTPSASTSSSTAWKAGRLPCTSESTAILRGSPLLSGGMGGHRRRLPLASARGGRRCRGGHAGPPAPSGLIDPAAIELDSLLQPG